MNMQHCIVALLHSVGTRRAIPDGLYILEDAVNKETICTVAIDHGSLQTQRFNHLRNCTCYASVLLTPERRTKMRVKLKLV